MSGYSSPHSSIVRLERTLSWINEAPFDEIQAENEKKQLKLQKKLLKTFPSYVKTVSDNKLVVRLYPRIGGKRVPFSDFTITLARQDESTPYTVRKYRLPVGFHPLIEEPLFTEDQIAEFLQDLTQVTRCSVERIDQFEEVKNWHVLNEDNVYYDDSLNIKILYQFTYHGSPTSLKLEFSYAWRSIFPQTFRIYIDSSREDRGLLQVFQEIRKFRLKRIVQELLPFEYVNS